MGQDLSVKIEHILSFVLEKEKINEAIQSALKELAELKSNGKYVSQSLVL